MNPAAVSIVIVNWNTRQLLSRCLQSILDHAARRPVELIVVDNASADGSAAMVARSYPQVILVQNQTNLGFATANNLGIRRSRGEYVCLVNSDILVLDSSIDRMCDYMDGHPQAGLLGPRLLNADRSLQPSCKRFPTLLNYACESFGVNKLLPRSRLFCGEHLRYFSHARLLRTEALVGAFLMVRRKALEEVGLLDEEFFIYGEEVDWARRFWACGWEVIFFPKAEIVHYGAASSAANPARFYRENYRSKLRYWRKHERRVVRVILAGITVARELLLIMKNAGAMALKGRTGLLAAQQIRARRDVALMMCRRGKGVPA